MLGLDEEKLSFWDYPDCRAIDYAGEIVGRLAAYMKDEQPSEVYTVAYEGGHPDHDFANYATVAAVAAQEEPPHAFEAPLYNAYRSRVIAVNRFIPAGTETIWTPMTLEDIRFKLRALFNYRSQFWITVVPVLLFAWPRVFGPGEPYRPVPRWNYLQPPHEGRLYYESYIMQRSMDVKFADFRRAVDSSMRSGSGE
jgi:LmbE family N-acetylglucosaminyl deacetylase